MVSYSVIRISNELFAKFKRMTSQKRECQQERT